MIEAVFIDRDGTLGGGQEVTFPNEFFYIRIQKRL